MKHLLPLWLDFVKAPPTQRASGYVLLAVSLALAIYLVQWSARNDSRVDQLEQRVVKLRQEVERQRLSAVPGTVREAPGENRWSVLFKTLEGAASDNVTLLRLQPGEREIVIDGEAKDLSAVLDYTARLHQSRELANAYLAKYELVRAHPRQPVRFTVLAGWRGAPPARGAP